jgi:hypothetical protein
MAIPARTNSLRGMWLVAALATACSAQTSTMPDPVAQTTTTRASELSQIVGQWEGTFTGGQGTQPATMTINPDGTYAVVIGGQTFPGKIVVTDGAFRGIGSTGRPGIWSLHESAGNRVLRYKTDDGRRSAELRPRR